MKIWRIFDSYFNHPYLSFMLYRFTSIHLAAIIVVGIFLFQGILQQLSAQDTTEANFWWKAGFQYTKEFNSDSAIIAYEIAYGEFEKIAKNSSENFYWRRTIECAIEAGHGYYDLHNYADGLTLAEKVTPISEQELGPSSTTTASCYNLLGRLYSKAGQFQLGLTYYKKELALNLQMKHKNLMNLARIYGNLGNSYKRIAQFDSAILMTKKSLNTFLDTMKVKEQNYAQGLFNIGMHHFDMKNFDSSVTYSLKSIDILEQDTSASPLLLSQTYNGLATAYLNLSNYSYAYAYFQKATRTAKQVLGENHPYIANLYANIGHLKSMTGNAGSALSWVKKALTIRQNFPGTSAYELGINYEFLARILIANKQPLEGIKYYKQAITILEKDPSLSPFFIGAIKSNLALVLAETGELDEALEQATEGISLLQTHRTRHIHELTLAYQTLGTVYRLRHNGKLSEQAYHKSLEMLHETADTLNEEYILTYMFLSRANMLNGDAELALSHIQKAISILDQYLLQLDEDQSILVIQEKYRQIFAAAALTCLDLADKSGNQDFLKEAFAFGEKNKSMLLLQKMRERQALKEANIPEEVIHQLFELQMSLAQEKQALIDLRLNPPSDSITISQRDDSVFQIIQRFNFLRDSLKHRYPTFKDISHTKAVISVKELQDALNPEQAMVEYLMSDTNLFVFVIRRDTFVVKRIMKDPLLEQKIQQFHMSLYPCSPFVKEPCKQEDKNGLYQQLAHELYEKLILPIEDLLPENLVIIPDGALGYLSFEALISQPVPSGIDYSSTPFWLYEKTISYALSATLWEEMRTKGNKNQPTESLLVMAPVFRNESSPENFHTLTEYLRNNFDPLPFSKIEAQSIHELVGGNIFLDTSATMQVFLKESSKYRFLHIATHGKILAGTPYSFLTFYGRNDSIVLKDTVQYGFSGLYINDLYNLELNADLIVLSACETGLGEYQEGEGIASLARGFTYSGAKSIIPSLWSVNDQSTAFLMQRFYQHLTDGKSKDIALRQAKLDLINEGQAHPFYWAAFVLMGDESPIEFTQSYAGYWMAAGLIILLLFGLLFLRKKRRVR